MGEFLQQLKEILVNLSMAKKMVMLATLAIAVFSIIYLINLSGKVSYEPLFTNLNSDDIGSIIGRLDKQNISYRVDQTQRTILVPADEVLKVRMKMAEEGLPRFGGIGFEIFDKSGFGKSDFEQRINFQRALEGELTRTITSLAEVEKARVHLVLPEKSIFSESSQAASASVILKIGRSGTLPESTVYAITHLVASSVEGLSSSQVTIVDHEGHLLTAAGGDSSILAGGQAYNQKMQIEKALEKRIVDMLSPVVGLGKVVARVSADIDFTRSETVEQMVDPNKTAVVLESKTKNKKSEGAGEAAAASANGSQENADTEQTNYEVSKTTKKQFSPVGALKNLSVAILVDGIYKDENGKSTYGPRSAEDLTRIEELVKNAIGFNSTRGDQLKVSNLQFQSPEAQLEQSTAWYQQKSTYGFIMTILANVLIVVVVLVVYLLVIKPLVKSFTQSKTKELGTSSNPLLEAGSSDVGQLVRVNPTAAAAALKKWLE